MRESLNRLSPALVSKNLSIGTTRGDADYVAALGLASMAYPIASPLIRMYLAQDRGAVHEARQAAAEMARTAARRQGISLRTTELADIGRQALDYALNKACPRCHGTKYELIPGTRSLGNVLCKSCSGDGRRNLPKRYRKLIIEVISRIERIESTLDVIVAKRV